MNGRMARRFKCCCCKELWAGIISFPYIEDGPGYPMLKVIKKRQHGSTLLNIQRIQTALIMAATESISVLFHSIRNLPRQNRVSMFAGIQFYRTCLLYDSLPSSHTNPSSNSMLLQYLRQQFQDCISRTAFLGPQFFIKTLGFAFRSLRRHQRFRYQVRDGQVYDQVRDGSVKVLSQRLLN